MKKINSYVLLFIIYIVYISIDILIMHSVFWDDWCIYNHSFNDVYGMYQKSGGQWLKPFIYLLKLTGKYELYFYKFISFASHLLTVLLFYRFLTKFFKWDNKTCLMASVLFIVAPFNYSKYLMINTFSTVLLTVFMFSLNFYISKNRLAHNLSYLGFAVSMYLQSLLVFLYIIPFYKLLREGLEIKSIKKIIKKDFILIIIPIVMYSSFKLFTSISSPYDSYNAPSLINAFNPLGYLKFFYSSFIIPLLSFSKLNVLSIAILSGVSFVLLRKKSLVDKKRKLFGLARKYDLLLLVMLAVLACFPYVAIGKMPDFMDIRSRHSILLVFFFVFFIMYVAMNARSLSNLVFGITISACLILKINVGVEYIRGSLKTDYLLEKFSSLYIEEDYLILKDKAPIRGTFSYSFYSLNGILRNANPESNYIVASHKGFEEFCSKNRFEYFYQWPEYNLQINKPCRLDNMYPVVLLKGEISYIDALKLSIVKVLSPVQYSAELNRAFKFDLIK